LTHSSRASAGFEGIVDVIASIELSFMLKSNFWMHAGIHGFEWFYVIKPESVLSTRPRIAWQYCGRSALKGRWTSTRYASISDNGTIRESTEDGHLDALNIEMRLAERLCKRWVGYRHALLG
jgi:hypothetical protein